MLGRYDRASQLPYRGARRVFQSQGTCQHRAYHFGQNAYFVSFGSQQLYATAFGRRHYVDDERERFGRREYGRKPERSIYYRAGRTFYTPPFRNAFHYADVQRTRRKGKSEPTSNPNGNGNSETQYLLCVRRVCEPSEIREYRGNGNGSAFARHTVFVCVAVVFATDRKIRQGRGRHHKDKLQGLCSIGRTKTKSGRAETDKPN